MMRMREFETFLSNVRLTNDLYFVASKVIGRVDEIRR